MTACSPSFSFTIPSVHDGCKLQCRIYLPGWLQSRQSATALSVRGAILAHPYAPLGGCYDDPVVSFLSSELLQQGYIVGTFNFRCDIFLTSFCSSQLTSFYSGAGGSGGRTSWTAKGELADYVSVYGFMLVYLHRLRHALDQGLPERSDPVRDPNADEDRRIHLILGGYSFGSLVASHVPKIDVMVDLFGPGTATLDTPIPEIRRRAGKMATTAVRHINPANPDGDSETEEIALSASMLISYLLVSPLRPPVSSFLTGFSNLSFSVGGASAQARPVPHPADQLSRHRTLAIYGDQDDFTSVRKLRRWSDELTRVPQSQFQGMVVEGAGHFWREEGVAEQARRALREWLRR